MLKAVLRGKKEEEITDRKKAGKIRMLIRLGIGLKRRIALAELKIKDVNEALLPFAEDLRTTTGLTTATFRSEDGDVEVRFVEFLAWDEKDMPSIKAALGPVFSRYFHEVPVFSVNPEDIPEIRERLGKDFNRFFRVQATYKHTPDLRDLLADGDSPVGEKLRALVRLEQKKPSVRYDESVAAQSGREAKKAEKAA